jgi:RNA polymerase sigma factor (sigma-70 family)
VVAVEQYLATPSVPTTRPELRGAAVDNRTDEDLLAAIAAGPGALPEFYRRHVAKIVGVGARRFDGPEEVADFVATVFLEVMESAGGFDPRRGSAVAWLYGLAANVAAREQHRRKRAAEAALRLSGRQFLGPDDYERIDERLDAAARARAVYAAMDGLRPDDRRLLVLVAVDGLSPAQAAAALGISRVATRVRLTRARRRLRAALADHPQAPAPHPAKEISA